MSDETLSGPGEANALHRTPDRKRASGLSAFSAIAGMKPYIALAAGLAVAVIANQIFTL